MKILFSLVTIVLLAGCQYNPNAYNYTTHKPTSEEFVGEYELAEIYMESYAPGIKDKVRSLPHPPTVRIRPDGRIFATNFPYFSEIRKGFEYRFEEFRTIETTWTQAVVGVIGDGSGTINDHHGILLNEMPLHMSRFGFMGKNKVDGIIMGFGDPDSGDAIIYKKK